MNRASSKAERLNHIQLILISSPSGLSRAELSRRIGVSRATISRYIDELSVSYNIKEDEKTKKITLDKLSFIAGLKLTAEEIQALHLACRLFGKKVKFNYPAASSVLRKLGHGLKRFASSIADEITSAAELFEQHKNTETHTYSEMIKIVSIGIARKQSLKFEHYSRRKKQWTTCLFSCYCIEPYAEGNSLYLVGCNEDVRELRTIKFELIRNIQITNKTYSIPDNFKSNEYFKDSWGIWTSDSEPIKVELLFSEYAKARILLTEWHYSEQTSELPDGRLNWQAAIDEPREMLPWIRGWGSEVEVIKPVWLRKLIYEDAQKTIAHYN